MEPLHSTYSNLSAWKATAGPAAGEIRIEFDTRRGIANAVAVFIGCLLAIIGLNHLDARKVSKGPMQMGLIILGITGSVTPLYIVASGMREKRKGPVLTYNTKTDTLRLPRLDLTIGSARECVHFSSEHYAGGTHCYELNVVAHGVRHPLVGTNVYGNLKPVAKAIGRMGFAINHQKIRK